MMRYTGTQYSEQEVEDIMREVRVRLAQKPKHRDEGIRRRDHGDDGVVRKTNDNARIEAASASAADAQPVPWTEWVDSRIEARLEAHAQVQCDAVAEYVEHQLNEIRRDLKLLRKEFEVEIKLDHRIAALNTEVAQARQQAPNFQSGLDSLEVQIEKLRKSMGALRAQHSTLEYNQRQLDKEKVTLTAVRVSAVGEATREVLRRVRDSGVDLDGMVPSGLLS